MIKSSGQNNVIRVSNVMNELIHLNGNNNIISLGSSIACTPQSSIRIIGNDNNIFIDDNVKFNDVNFTLKGNNITFHIGKNVEFTGVILSIFMNCSFRIGQFSTLRRGEITIAEGTDVSIGKDCMFAHEWEVRTSDMHPIYSLENGERINHGKSIKMGDHIWVGGYVKILKGVELADNMVIGMNSVITNSIHQGNCIVAGAPAKIIRQNVVWGRMMYHKTMYDGNHPIFNSSWQ